MKRPFPVFIGGTITVREFMTGPINKELPEQQARKSASTRKKKATKKQLKALEQLFAK